MITLKHTSLLCLLFLFILGCTEEDAEEITESAIQNATGNYIKSTIDGQSFEPAVVSGSLDTNSVILAGIDGLSSNYPQMVITVPKNADPQTYNYPIDLSDTSIKAVGILYSLNDSTSYIYNSGSFQLTKHDKTNKRIEANFQGYLYRFSTTPDSILLSAGSLRVSYN